MKGRAPHLNQLSPLAPNKSGYMFYGHGIPSGEQHWAVCLSVQYLARGLSKAVTLGGGPQRAAKDVVERNMRVEVLLLRCLFKVTYVLQSVT